MRSNNRLNGDVERVLTAPSRVTEKVKYSIVLKNNTDLRYLNCKIVDVETTSDYNGNVADILIIEVLIPMGDYVHDIYPFKDVLECELLKSAGGFKYIEKLDVLVVNGSKNVEGGHRGRKSKEDLNKEEMVSLKLQCVNKKVNILRLITLSGTFFKTNLKNLLLNRISKVLQGITINGNNINCPLFIDEFDNKETYDQIIIPTGTKFFDLPTVFQEGEYGIYNGYAGTYLTKYRIKKEDNIKQEIIKEGLFVYPLYKITQYEKSEKQLKLYSTPNGHVDLTDNIHLDNDNYLELVVSDQVELNDDAFLEIKNKGIGYKSFSSNTLLKRNVRIDGSVISSSKDIQMKDEGVYRRDDLNVSSSGKATDNFYLERSKLLKKAGSLIEVQWNFSMPELLIPNMKTRYYYLDKSKKISYIDGTLQFVYTRYDASTRQQNSILYIFVSRQT